MSGTFSGILAVKKCDMLIIKGEHFCFFCFFFNSCMIDASSTGCKQTWLKPIVWYALRNCHIHANNWLTTFSGTLKTPHPSITFYTFPIPVTGPVYNYSPYLNPQSSPCSLRSVVVFFFWILCLFAFSDFACPLIVLFAIVWTCMCLDLHPASPGHVTCDRNVTDTVK